MLKANKYLKFLVLSLCFVFVLGITAYAADVTVKSLKASTTSISKVKPGDTKTVTLTATMSDKTVDPDAASKATWESSDESVATVDAGTIEIVGPGKATVKATYGGKYVKISVNASLSSLAAYDEEADKKVTSVSLQPSDEVQLILKGSYPTTPKVLEVMDGNWIQWSSKNTSIAEVDENGLVTAKAPGSTSITAKCGGKTVTVSVKVAFSNKDDLTDFNQIKEFIKQITTLRDKSTKLDVKAKAWLDSVIELNQMMLDDPFRVDYSDELDAVKASFRALSTQEKEDIAIESLKFVQLKYIDLNTVIELILKYDIFSVFEAR